MQIVAGQITVADLAAMAEATDDPAVREAIEELIGRVVVP